MPFMLRTFLLLALAGSCYAEPQVARGVIQSVNTATLSSEIAARVTQVPYRDGDTFAKGDVLLKFDCRLFNAQLDKTQADLRAAQAKLENDRKLEKLGSVGVMKVVLAETEVDQAQAEMRMARINVERCVVIAPWSGRVVQQFVQAQESVELHQKMLSIVSTDQLELNLRVPSDWSELIKTGDQLVVTVDETQSRHTAVVITTGSVVDPVSQTLAIRALLPSDPRLLPGMSGTAVLKRP